MTVRVVYREGAFIPQDACELQDGAEGLVLVASPAAEPPTTTDAAERRRLLAELVESLRKHPLPLNSPKLSAIRCMNAIDTNILLYARDPREPGKQQTALVLIQSLSDAVLRWQVACEYVAASRKLQTAAYTGRQAWQDIIRLAKLWPLRAPTQRAFILAQLIHGTHSLSVWDALLLGACVDAGVVTLYTEDLQHGETIEGVTVVNPFI